MLLKNVLLVKYKLLDIMINYHLNYSFFVYLKIINKILSFISVSIISFVLL